MNVSDNQTSLKDIPSNCWVIQAENLTKVYKMGEVEVHALNGLSLKIACGEIVAIMGPSGSGKSTLMNIIGCLDRPTSGEYFLDNEPVARLTDDQLATIRNRKVGFVFQSFNLLNRATALANVELPLRGGQQQRVAIARALVNDPAIIMADEPTGNLDTKSGHEILELLLNLNREHGTTLIIVTHAPDIATQSQRIVRIRDGVVEEAV
jgi:putative ABC transport system ATP-binding protein